MKKSNVLLPALGLALLAAGVTAREAPYREHHPRAEIRPEAGVAGDFSGTYPYWKDEAALAQHAAWADGKHPDAWKLNWKYMDLDRVDLHPGHMAVDEGEKLFKRFVKWEPGLLTCLGEGSRDLKGLAAAYPKYDAALKRVVTLEDRIEHCAKTAMWEDIKQGSPTNTKLALYIKSLSTGQPIRVDLGSEPVRSAYERGETLFYAKVGQLNFACASCHTPGSIMGHKLRGETPTTPFGDVAHYPTYRTPVGELESLHQRFGRCLNQMRAEPLKPGDPAYVDLEVFLSVLSNGYPVSVPSAR